MNSLMSKCVCCGLNIKAMNEEQRDKLITKIAEINEMSNRESTTEAEVVETLDYLDTLSKEGYDVETYKNIFKRLLSKQR